jgi:hypothetical protein
MAHKLTVNFLKDIYIDELKEKLGLDFKIKKEKMQNVLEGIKMYNLPKYEIDTDLLYSKGIIYYDDVDIFKDVFTKKVNEKTTYVYYPEPRPVRYKNKAYNSTETYKNKYPIYIVSKGRYDTRYTSKSLENFGIDYKIIVEKEEYEEYAKVIDPHKILVIPEHYFTDDTYGSIPARKFAWDHAVDSGTDKHWCLDDNIRHFYRLNLSNKFKLKTGNFFHIIENYTDYFSNIGQSGMMESKFVPAIEQYKRRIITRNTRVFSCILINHSLLMDNGIENWRGKYNEDTDLSLRVLKSGLTTCLFNQFLIDKPTTLSMKGGNSDKVHINGGLLKRVESLIEQHPEHVKYTYRFKKHHFLVNYKPFKNTPYILKDEFKHIEDVDEMYNDWGFIIEDK